MLTGDDDNDGNDDKSGTMATGRAVVDEDCVVMMRRSGMVGCVRVRAGYCSC